MSTRIPKYRKHKPSGRAVVTLDGKDHYLGKYGTAASEKNYRRLISEYVANDCRLPSAGETTMVELMAAYLNWAKSHYKQQPGGKKSSDLHMVKALIRLIRPNYAEVRCSEFSARSAKALMQQMEEDGQSRGYINRQLSRLKHMLRWGVSEDLVSPTVADRISAVSGLQKGKTTAKEGKGIASVLDSVVDATIKHLPPVVDDMVRLQRLTAARPGEIVIMRPMDIDQSQEVWRYVPESHKTEAHGIDRVILIGPKAQAILKPYLEDRADRLWCFSPKDSRRMAREKKSGERVTPAHYGNRPGSNRVKNANRMPGLKYTTDSYRRAVNRACDLAKVERWSPNRLRHTAATKIREQFGLEAAQYVLGHSKADTTQIYAERNLKLAADAIKRQG